ncbi:hypothetical protein EMIHUDRAFT_75503, partial [Emiliania huxleyi CCMP1516]|uniref:Protein kinase domain-containing protein n=2 Tax=Emiliania huxleyi TaxID=2903 RepID=A0A0D3J6U4_EMIH1
MLAVKQARSKRPLPLLTNAEEKQYTWAIRRSDFEIKEQLSKGAYGEVWGASWRRNDVAVKLIARGSGDCDANKGKTDFVREMQLLSGLGGHRNVVRFLGACLDAQRMFILLELCPSSLSDRLYKEDTDLNEHEMLVVALGLNYLHHCEPPVLHLDLKSANVLLDESGTAKVCFGPFHSMEDAANRFDPAERSGIGYPQCIAPEILRGGRYDVKADTYSFGVLLFEVL